jgi:hypothetical protein
MNQPKKMLQKLLIKLFGAKIKKSTAAALPIDRDFVCDKCNAWGCNTLDALFDHGRQCKK